MRVNRPLSLHSSYPKLFTLDESKQDTKPTLALSWVIQADESKQPLRLHSLYPELFNPDESKLATKPTLALSWVIQPGWEQKGCKKLTLTLSWVFSKFRWEKPGRPSANAHQDSQSHTNQSTSEVEEDEM
jgi:hypothetical protein